MAREFAESFYKTQAWKKCRASYAKSVGGLCETCLKKGIYRPGQIVHHIVHISEDNINDATVTLNWNNLRLVCRECHGQEHNAEGRRRYKIDEFGNVIIK